MVNKLTEWERENCTEDLKKLQMGWQGTLFIENKGDFWNCSHRLRLLKELETGCGAMLVFSRSQPVPGWIICSLMSILTGLDFSALFR
jgi:hypothetical protein